MTRSVVQLANSVWTGVVRLVARVLGIFGITIGTPRGTPTRCGPTDGGPGCKPNPWPCGSDIVVRVSDGTGALATYEECGDGPHVLVRADRGFVGIDVAARAELRFPPARTVTVRAVHFSNPGRIEAFEQTGTLADMQMMAPTPAVEQQFTLRGSAIDLLVVTPPSPADEARVIQVCH
jgi:hypothetical protein